MRKTIYRTVPPALLREIERGWFLRGLTVVELCKKLQGEGVVVARSTLHRHLKDLSRKGFREQLLLIDAIESDISRAFAAVLEALLPLLRAGKRSR